MASSATATSAPSPRASHPPRIAGLDGLRAISIGLVIYSHVAHKLPAIETKWIELGNFGVRVFFVISGFLITTLLLDEERRSGRAISLGQFYLRRVFRIFPAFYVYLALVVLAGRLGWVALGEGDLLAAATYTMNYHPTRAWEVGHLWSLSVEEQFYLAWPLLFRVSGGRARIAIALGVVAAAPIVRVATVLLWPAQRGLIGESFQTVADTLAVGCALALLRARLDATPRFVRVQEHAAAPFVYALIAVVAHALHDHIRLSYSVGETIVNVSIALVVDSVVRRPGARLTRALEWRPLAFVGQLSYSLYLWQQPFMTHDSARWATALPQALGLCVAAALASYYLVEKPFLQLRKRVAGAAN